MSHARTAQLTLSTLQIFTPVGLSSTDGGESDAKSKQKEKTKKN
jgi:hypothetical protein